MIELNEIFSDSDKRIAFWCESVEDTNDLAIMCENIVNNNVKLISVPPIMVHNVWTYLEKKGVKILTRYDFSPLSKNIDSGMYELAEKITAVCKHGADGVQVFVKMHDFERFIDSLQIVRNDLFFGHDLCIGMDARDIDVNNLDSFFQRLRDVRANSLTITLNEESYELHPYRDFQLY